MANKNEATSRYFNLSVGDLVKNKTKKLLNAVLPEGFEVDRICRSGLNFSYVIKRKGFHSGCAIANTFWSNGPMIRFSVQLDSVEGLLFIKAMKEDFNVSESQILTI
jgi:hypothetical protein